MLKFEFLCETCKFIRHAGGIFLWSISLRVSPYAVLPKKLLGAGVHTWWAHFLHAVLCSVASARLQALEHRTDAFATSILCLFITTSYEVSSHLCHFMNRSPAQCTESKRLTQGSGILFLMPHLSIRVRITDHFLHSPSAFHLCWKVSLSFVLNSNLCCAMMIVLTLCISQQTAVMLYSPGIVRKWGVLHN